jgi:hypothetical protein
LRPLERTFPFSSVGEDFAAADFLEAFAMPQSVTPPFRALYGNVESWSWADISAHHPDSGEATGTPGSEWGFGFTVKHPP